MAVELSIRELRSGYGPLEVLHGVDLDVPAARVTGLLGPNGAGKTTLLRTLGGHLRSRAICTVRRKPKCLCWPLGGKHRNRGQLKGTHGG